MKMQLALTAAAVLLAVGALDALTWGGGLFHSYVTNIRINLALEELITDGSPPWEHLYWLLTASTGFAAVCISSGPEGSPAIRSSAAARRRRPARPCTAVEQAVPFRLRGDSALLDGGSRHPGAAPVPRVDRAAPPARRGCVDAGVRVHRDYRGRHPERVAVPGHRVPVSDRAGRPRRLSPRSGSGLPCLPLPGRRARGHRHLAGGPRRTSICPATTICTAPSPSTTRIRDLSASRTADGSELASIATSVSHIVSADPATSIPGYSVERTFGPIRVLRRDGREIRVRQWEVYAPTITGGVFTDLMRQLYPDAPAPPPNSGIRFVDEHAEER